MYDFNVGERVEVTTIRQKGTIIRYEKGYPIVQLDGEGTANAWQEEELESLECDSI